MPRFAITTTNFKYGSEPIWVTATDLLLLEPHMVARVVYYYLLEPGPQNKTQSRVDQFNLCPGLREALG